MEVLEEHHLLFVEIFVAFLELHLAGYAQFCYQDGYALVVARTLVTSHTHTHLNYYYFDSNTDANRKLQKRSKWSKKCKRGKNVGVKVIFWKLWEDSVWREF